MTAPDEDHRAQQRFAGGCLIAVGGLFATLCGLCTAVFVGGPIWYAATTGGAFAWPLSAMGLVVGGIPTAVGVAQVVVGANLLRRGRRTPPDS
jgi:hypothetical protein